MVKRTLHLTIISYYSFQKIVSWLQSIYIYLHLKTIKFTTIKNSDLSKEMLQLIRIVFKFYLLVRFSGQVARLIFPPKWQRIASCFHTGTGICLTDCYCVFHLAIHDYSMTVLATL